MRSILRNRYLSALERADYRIGGFNSPAPWWWSPREIPQSIALNRRLATGNYILRAQLDDGLYREAEFSITRAFAGTPKIALTAEQSFAPRPGGTLSIGVAFSRGGRETISPCNISLWVEDSSGRRVRTLAQEELSVFRLDGKTGRVKGENRYRWDGKDDGGNPLPAGNYYLRARGFGGRSGARGIRPVELTRIQMGLTVLGPEGEGLSGAELLLNGISLGETDSSGHLDFSAYGGLSCLNHSAQGGSPFVAQLRLARSGELTLRLFSGDGFWRSFSVQSPSGEELLAGFDPMEAEYRLVVPAETEVVTIDAMAAHQRAVVFGLGKAELGGAGVGHCDPGAGDGRGRQSIIIPHIRAPELEEGGSGGRRRCWMGSVRSCRHVSGGRNIRRGSYCVSKPERAERSRRSGSFAMEDLFSQSSFAGTGMASGALRAGDPA